MQLTTKSRYAIRAVLDIARHQGDQRHPVRRSDIGQREGFSEDYLEQLLLKLREAGLMEAVRGPGGGYRLRHAPGQITVWQVVSAVDDRLDVAPCTLTDAEPCKNSADCQCQDFWRHLKNVVFTELNSITIADIINGRFAGEPVRYDPEPAPAKPGKPKQPCRPITQ